MFQYIQKVNNCSVFLFKQDDLSNRILALQEALGKVQEETANEIARLQLELDKKNKVLQDLQKQLDEQHDYEDIKKHCQ